MNRPSEEGLRLPIVKKLFASAKQAGLSIEALANTIFPEEERTKRENDLLRESFLPSSYLLLDDVELERLRAYTGKPLPRPSEPEPTPSAPAACTPAPVATPVPAFVPPPAPPVEEPVVQTVQNLGMRAAWEAAQADNRRRNRALQFLDAYKTILAQEADATGDVNLRDGLRVQPFDDGHLIIVPTSRWYPPDGSSVINVGCAVDERDVENHWAVIKEGAVAATRSRSYDWPSHLPPPNPDFWVRGLMAAEGMVTRTWQNAHGKNKDLRWERWFVFYTNGFVEVTEAEYKMAWALRQEQLRKAMPQMPVNGPPPPSFD